MINFLKQLFKNILKIFSLEIHWIAPASSPTKQIFTAIELAGCNLVFDIGANIGQFASELRSSGYKGRIVSFEPLSSAHTLLCKKTKRDKDWHVHGRSAIGDVEGEIQINISGNSVSSSVLSMLQSHKNSAPTSHYIGQELVPITQLDTIASSYINEGSNIFIKIDTQGFEWQVLNGAKDVLNKASGVLCELSLVPLYEGQYLWREIIDRLESCGFVLWSIQKGFTDKTTGRSLQIDAIFLRA